MIIGNYNRGKIVLLTSKACFLDLGWKEDVFLPPFEVPKGASKGDEIEVFVYNTSAEEVRATTVKPLAVLGEFAALEVTEVTGFGMFLAWGPQKDLFVPTRNIRTELKPGDKAVVKIVNDYSGSGVIGTSRFDDLFDPLPENSGELYRQNARVDLIVYGFSKLGARVIVDKKYSGMLYKNEIFENLVIGEHYTGYIKKVREDGLIDAALQPQGYVAATGDARLIILDALETAGGFLPLHDRSNADEIKRRLLMSKKVFKKTVGALYKEKKIAIEENGIRLLA